MRDWPYEAFPTGWYQIGYSAELKTGDVEPVKYFDQQLVLFRTEDGQASLLDAYCPHLGAHLGYGGKVQGDCIECPFHGWQWRGDGSLGTIPYDPEADRRVRIPAWHTREVAGLLLAWYDGFGREPFWEWPGITEFLDEENFYPIFPQGADHIGIRKIIPQSPVENTPDFEHFPYVHGAGRAGNPILWEEKEHYLRTRISFLFGANKAKTWLTPDGPMEGEIETEAWGLGLSNARFKVGEFVTSQLTATTPVDAEHSKLFDTITATREPGDAGDEPTGRSGKMITFQKGQIRHDFKIWENQRYVEHPPFAGREADAYASFRRWSKQFYFGPNGESKPAAGH
ncbi:Rieske 2Fe-2S domain-containing protein [Nocardia sp. BMG111209]|uniref:Rieske 2Fe-2S domain-containing protein n=1 Tax=Nocardia sp. BMG111209 TaxID=1160137 RepID=UPI0003677EAC|nr:Rieske 2Fe-2S domain-containing protein [Nocardia sp. BMG111209]